MLNSADTMDRWGYSYNDITDDITSHCFFFNLIRGANLVGQGI